MLVFSLTGPSSLCRQITHICGACTICRKSCQIMVRRKHVVVSPDHANNIMRPSWLTQNCQHSTSSPLAPRTSARCLLFFRTTELLVRCCYWMTSRSRLTRELKLNPGLNHEIAGPRIWELACRKPVDPINAFTDEKSVEGGRLPLQI
jgi:hypothetical protein